MITPRTDSRFQIDREHFVAAYRRLDEAELRRRAEQAVQSLESCRTCPRNCEVNRLADEAAVCRTGRYARVASYFAHFGEEDCLRGRYGSGTIFFAMCNLRCVFCQNHEISHRPSGKETRPEELASMMLSLQERGCHNINFVTPEHVVPQILEALPFARAAGLQLPIVYNTSAYDSLESLRLLEGIVDIYMPDLKMLTHDHAKRYLKASDYADAARAAIVEMHRQVGDLCFDERGLAKRGLLVRHLLMPDDTCDTAAVMRFVAGVSRDTYVNIMDQYAPAARVYNDMYSEINRPIYEVEYRQAFQAARDAGLHRFDYRRSFRRGRRL